MEEKERFELFGEHCIKDNNPDARCQLLDAYVSCVILNEQDKENQQLKQELHDLPNKIVEEISKELKSLYKNYPIIYSEDKDIVKSCYDKDSVNKILDTILKKFGEKDE